MRETLRLFLILAVVAAAWIFLPVMAQPPSEVLDVHLTKLGPGEVLTFPGLFTEPVRYYTIYRGDLTAPFDGDFQTLGELRVATLILDETMLFTVPVNDDNPAGNFYFLVTATGEAGEGTLGVGSDDRSRGWTYGDPPAGEPELYPMEFPCTEYFGELPPPFDPPGNPLEEYEFPDLCPPGFVPEPFSYDAPKGLPEDEPATLAESAPLQGSYYYANAYSWPMPHLQGGAGVSLAVFSPIIDRNPLTHSLAELAVQGGPIQGNIVEIGWTVDRGLNQDVDPHLFVFHWVNWVPSVYNGGGWRQYSRSMVPGMKLRSGMVSYAGWVYWGGNWWGWWNNQWLGYFPGSQWGGSYINSNFHQWFGEVHAVPVPPNNFMGNGNKGSNPWPAPAWMANLCEVDTPAWLCWLKLSPTLRDTHPLWYDCRSAGQAVRYGGPGR